MVTKHLVSGGLSNDYLAGTRHPSNLVMLSCRHITLNSNQLKSAFKLSIPEDGWKNVRGGRKTYRREETEQEEEKKKGSQRMGFYFKVCYQLMTM